MTTLQITTGNEKISSYIQTKKFEIGDTKFCRVSHVYDLSKFYIVILHRELALFQSFLVEFYIKNNKKYKMKATDIKRTTICLALVNGSYYRGEIVNIPHFGVISPKVMVFLFDYGYTAVVKATSLFYLDEKFYGVPRFAIRASLYGVQPYKTHMWPSKACKRFCSVVDDKILICKINDIDTIQSTVYISIGLPDEENVKDLTEVLANENILKLSGIEPDYEGGTKQYLVPKTKYPFLFPTFDSIETGKVPATVEQFEDFKRNFNSFKYLEPYYNWIIH